MPIECYTATCRWHSCHRLPDIGPFCDRGTCDEDLLLMGEIKTSSGPGKWGVWNGKRWIQCWTFLGATLLQVELRGQKNEIGSV